MRLKISHTTRYTFSDPVRFGLQQLRKTPKSSDQQCVVDWQTDIEGGKKELSFDDHHNNVVELISFEKDVSALVVTSSGEVEVTETHGVVGRHRGPAPLWIYQTVTDLTKPGRHPTTGKSIEPMALSANRQRLSDPVKAERWLNRNCRWTLGRECTAQEKGDFVLLMQSR